MMKEMKDSIMPVESITSKLWSSFDILRGELPAGDFHLILFLLSIYKDGYLKEAILSNPDEIKRSIELSIQNENHPQYSEIYKAFDHSFQRLNNRSLYSIIQLLFNLDVEKLRLHFSDIFDDVLYRLTKSQGRHGGEFIQPIELSRMVCNLADLEPNSKVFNPFAGAASFGVFPDGSQYYLGQEINHNTWAIGALRLLAYDRSVKSRFVKDDSILNWPDEQKFDLIVSSPPLDLRLGSNPEFSEYRTAEQFLIEKGIASLTQKGKLIAVLSNGFLFRGGPELSLREYLVKSDLLDSIISLPGGLLSHTGIPLVILVLNKAKDKSGFVKFIDAKTFVATKSPREKVLNDYDLNSFIKTGNESEFSITVSNDTIREYEFNLNVPRYFQKQYDGFPLRELVSEIRGQRVSNGQKGKFIRIRDLKDDALNFQLILDEVEETEIPRNALKISESCLLLASRWKTLKPTYFEYTGTPIFIIPDTLGFKVDESKCDLNFLINELHAGYVTEQLDTFRTGSVIPMIKKEHLLSVIIALPSSNGEQSLVEQKLIVKKRLLELAEEKKKELSLFNKIHGLETEIVEQNTYLRHTLAGPASNLKDSISNIKRIIAEKAAISYPELLNLKISDKHLICLGEYLDIIERDANKIVKAVSSQLKVDTGIEAKKLSTIEIISFLEKYSNEYNERTELNFTIKFELDEEVFVENGQRVKMFILGNDELLRDLFDNLLDNARRHAFQDDKENRIEIFITKSEDGDKVLSLFSNTGKPIPKDFTINEFVRKGAKYGENAGDGFGGWYINEIIKKLNGEIDLIDETGPEGLADTDLATSFEINFPIIETEENV